MTQDERYRMNRALQLSQTEISNTTEERYRIALVAIAAFPPGDFRPLEDEVKIWKLATDALKTPQSDARAEQGK